MKSTSRKTPSAAVLLSLFAASSCISALSIAHAEETAKPTKASTKAPRAKAQVGTGSIDEVNTTTLKFTDKTGAHEILLNDATNITRVETGVPAADLKVGDTLVLSLPGTNGRPTVQSLTPLTLQFDNASITFSNTGKAKFARQTKISAAELAAGQTVKVTFAQQADGSSTASSVVLTAARAK